MLDGLRVLDLCDERGQLAGKLLGDLGADVTLVEPPGGSPLRQRGPFYEGAQDLEASLPFWSLNTSKRGLTIDLRRDGERRLLDRLLERSDVLIESFSPSERAEWNLRPPDVARRHPRLVHASITPYGTSGPRAKHVGRDLTIVAMGGNAALTGNPERAPLRCSLPTAYFHGGSEAVIGILLGLWARELDGVGQHVDVSLQECQLGSLLSGPGQRKLGAPSSRRSGPRLGRSREIWAARDGWISFGLRGGPARVPNLIATVELMAEHGAAPDWLRNLDWKTWDPQKLSPHELAKVEAAFAAFFAAQPKAELYEQALVRRILLAPCNDGRAVLQHAQLRARNLFGSIEEPIAGVALEHPLRFALWQSSGGGRIGITRRAPRLDEHRAAIEAELALPSKPIQAPLRAQPSRARLLADLRVLELGSGAAGPLVTKYFAEYGAQVIRIESERRPDFLRFLQPHGANGLDRAPMFALLNPDKRSLALDMGQPAARNLLERLILEWADLVCENFAPGVLERWEIDLAALCRRKPSLVVVQSCLFGQTGPQRHYPGFGGQGSAIAGFNHLTGYPNAEALGPYATITDSLSPRFAAAAALAALWRRWRSGVGGTLDLSQIEAGVYALSEMIVRESAGAAAATRIGNRDGHAAPHGIFRAAGEDEWLALAVFSNEEWRALANELARDGFRCEPTWNESAGRLEDEAALEARIEGWTRVHSAPQLAERLQAVGVDAAPVQDFDALLGDAQLAHRGHFVPVSHGLLGELWCERSGFRLSRDTGGFSRGGPLLGEHSREVLRETLRLADTEIDQLEAAGALR